MADGQQSPENQALSIREKSRRWFVAVGATAAVLATILSFLSDSVGVWQFLKNYQATATPVEAIASKEVITGMISNTVTATITPLPAETQSATATPIITPTNTP